MDEIAEIIAYLSARVNVRVAAEVPANKPQRLITVGRVGGNGSRYLDNPRIDIDAWAGSDYEASSLLNEVIGYMYDLPGTSDLISEVEKNSQYRSDLDGWHRWTASFNVTRNM